MNPQAKPVAPAKPKSMLSDAAMKTSVKVFTWVALATILAFAAVDFWLISKLPFLNQGRHDSTRELVNSIVVAGYVFGSLPLLGVIIKYALAFYEKQAPSKNVRVQTVTKIMHDILTFERKTRLVTGWLAIVMLLSHFIYWGSLIENNAWRQGWNGKTILGTAGIALIIVMNINGFGILYLRKRKLFKYIKLVGYTNLVFGLTFFALALAHIFID